MVRDTRIGAAGGLHLPGILPEPDVVEGQERDWTPEELAVLDDLDEALPPEDHEADSDNGRDAEGTPAPAARLRSDLPWWAGSLAFSVAGLLCWTATLVTPSTALRTVFALVGLAFVWLSARSWSQRVPRPRL